MGRYVRNTEERIPFAVRWQFPIAQGLQGEDEPETPVRTIVSCRNGPGIEFPPLLVNALKQQSTPPQDPPLVIVQD